VALAQCRIVDWLRLVREPSTGLRDLPSRLPDNVRCCATTCIAMARCITWDATRTAWYFLPASAVRPAIASSRARSSRLHRPGVSARRIRLGTTIPGTGVILGMPPPTRRFVESTAHPVGPPPTWRSLHLDAIGTAELNAQGGVAPERGARAASPPGRTGSYRARVEKVIERPATMSVFADIRSRSVDRDLEIGARRDLARCLVK
jgi:hypothetical protein